MPKYDCYIEGFLGTGAIFLNKPLAKYNILNDHSRFIYELFLMLKEEPCELYRRVEDALIYDKIINENQDKIEYQLLRSLYSIYTSCTATIVLGRRNAKKIFLEKLALYRETVQKMLMHTVITCRDIFKFLASIESRNKIYSTFIYLDPPYAVSKGRLFDNKGWSLSLLEKLIVEVKRYEWQFAISEFDDTAVIELFKKHGLYITTISKSSGASSKFGYDKHEILATSFNLRVSQDDRRVLFK
ncbi:hypothetical protein DB313_06090 (plasmid) [Borrelia turcica IST7]|uniref:site-specific DNA-methyltransferase (adenine-specific) n=1 Tax=Borrelia turcica IST7 TaxID=1104446 RepID=A0A386PNM0_9SPIR|nr:DNA adenine methylase [Borrelia turcica]AYE37071.1 hypothetical protein DB313_06090 [Borrelia turcica IST7]